MLQLPNRRIWPWAALLLSSVAACYSFLAYAMAASLAPIRDPKAATIHGRVWAILFLVSLGAWLTSALAALRSIRKP